MSDLKQLRMATLHPREARKRWASAEKRASNYEDQMAARKLKHVMEMTAIAKRHEMPLEELLGMISAGPQ